MTHHKSNWRHRQSHQAEYADKLRNMCEVALLLLQLQREADEEIDKLIEDCNNLATKHKAQIAAWEQEQRPSLVKRRFRWW